MARECFTALWKSCHAIGVRASAIMQFGQIYANDAGRIRHGQSKTETALSSTFSAGSELWTRCR